MEGKVEGKVESKVESNSLKVDLFMANMYVNHYNKIRPNNQSLAQDIVSESEAWFNNTGVCKNSQLKLIQFIVDNDMPWFNKCESKIKYFNVWLYFACAKGRLEIVQYLIECGRKLNITINLKKGLVAACRNGHFKIVHYLVEYTEKNQHSNTKIHN